MNQKIAVFWFRRDLRIDDNHGLFRALQSRLKILPIFIFDSNILDELKDRRDKRVTFIYRQLEYLDKKFRQKGSCLKIFYGSPLEVWKEIVDTHSIKAVYTNHDYEPYAIGRDKVITEYLSTKGIEFHSYKDQVIFEKSDVLKADSKPYTVFTPYSKQWKLRLTEDMLNPYNSNEIINSLYSIDSEFININDIGFELVEEVDTQIPTINQEIIQKYDNTRNFPAIPNGTTRLSVHLRFGTLSIRQLVKLALKWNDVWLNELIWREFFMQVLYHFPHVVKKSFKPQYEDIQWRNNETEFGKWCRGETGYPIVDAGMRELNQTGFMHNRVRMIVASFLCKHLLIDWRWGEAYFAGKLLDFDLSANNGNWQWAAGTGCDAAPYFRIFNPSEQTKKFDVNNDYIRKWLRANDLLTPPIVEHSFARNRALETYKKALKV